MILTFLLFDNFKTPVTTRTGRNLNFSGKLRQPGDASPPPATGGRQTGDGFSAVNGF
jgi:hypothetical protein